MARARPAHEDLFGAIGAAAAFAAADRRRAALCDAKQAWLEAFDAFKAEEALRGRPHEARDHHTSPDAADEYAAAHMRLH